MNFDVARTNMLKQQCRTWEVTDPQILQLLATTPRETFVPPQLKSLALADMAIDLAHEQKMFLPKEEARILAALQIQVTEKVLEIGTGTGYLTALLAQQAKAVESIDIFVDFTEAAAKKLFKFGIRNVQIHTADAMSGLDEYEKYDAILVSGALTVVPKHFFQQLNMGGRLLVFLGDYPIMKATLMTKISENNINAQFLFETYLPVLINAPRISAFEL